MGFFDKEAELYDSWYQSKEGDYVLQKENELLQTFLTGEYSKGLDVGCGTGQHSIVLKQHTKEVIGIDVSTKMLEVGNNKYNDISFLHMDATNTTFPDNHFDIVISMAMIEFVPNRTELFNELFRVLKPGGTLLIGTIQKGSHFADMYETPFFQENTVFKHASFMTKEDIKKFYSKDHVVIKECLFNSYENITNNPHIKDQPLDKVGSFMISLWKKGV